MKITFIMPELSLHGGNRVVAEYSKQLVKFGHDVTIVARVNEWPRLRELVRGKIFYPTFDKVVVDFFDNLRDHVRIVRGRGKLEPNDLPDADFMIGTWWETLEWIRDLPDRKGRVGHLMQGYEMFPWLPANRVALTYELDTIKIAVSDWVRDKVYVNHSRMADAVIHNAVDTERFPFAEKRREPSYKIGFIYSNEKMKNSRMVFEVRRLLKERGINTSLLTFHSDLLADEYRNVEGMESYHKPEQDIIPRLYQSCDLWLFPTIEEGFGLPILEAMACGTPVVSTTAGAAPQLMKDGSNGFLCATEASAFADAIQTYFSMAEEERVEMSYAARQTAISWTWENAAQKLVNVLKQKIK